MFHQAFFIEGRYMGDCLRSVPLGEHKPLSILLFCNECGEVWARFPVEGRRWISYARLCRKHQSPWPSQLPGSIWLPWDHYLLDALPLPVLQWEFERELDYFDKVNNER